MTELQLTILTPHLPPDISVKSGQAADHPQQSNTPLLLGFSPALHRSLVAELLLWQDNPVHSVAAA